MHRLFEITDLELLVSMSTSKFRSGNVLENESMLLPMNSDCTDCTVSEIAREFVLDNPSWCCICLWRTTCSA